MSAAGSHAVAHPTPSFWRLSAELALSLDQPRIMGILNATPDSFSDGGMYMDPERAAAAAADMIQSGASILDIGGESTRPGASRIPAAEQIRRVVPVIRRVRDLGGAGSRVGITIDTTLPEVARAALDAGADAINDVSAGREGDQIEGPGAMLKLAAKRSCGIILMHRLVAPDQDSYSDRYASPPTYGDVVASVRAALSERAHAALDAGVSRESIVLDPGLGFGKSVAQNLELIARTSELAILGFPLLSAASRKSFVGRISLNRDSEPDERLAGSIAVSLLHLERGVRLFRVHDVPEQAGAIRAAWSILNPNSSP